MGLVDVRQGPCVCVDDHDIFGKPGVGERVDAGDNDAVAAGVE